VSHLFSDRLGSPFPPSGLANVIIKGTGGHCQVLRSTNNLGDEGAEALATILTSESSSFRSLPLQAMTNPHKALRLGAPLPGSKRASALCGLEDLVHWGRSGICCRTTSESNLHRPPGALFYTNSLNLAMCNRPNTNQGRRSRKPNYHSRLWVSIRPPPLPITSEALMSCRQPSTPVNLAGIHLCCCVQLFAVP